MTRRTKRLWMDEEKRSICFQTTAPSVSVVQVARRYAMNANMIFKWLRDPHYTSEAGSGALAIAADSCVSRCSIGLGTTIRLRPAPQLPA